MEEEEAGVVIPIKIMILAESLDLSQFSDP